MKQVRLVVGEGANKVEVGTAKIEQVPNGDPVIEMTVTYASIIKMLGGNQVKGTITKITEEDPDAGS